MSNYSKCKYFPEFKDFQSGCSTCDWINPAKYYNTQGWSNQYVNVTGGKNRKGGSKQGVCNVAEIGPSKPSDLKYNGPFNMTESNWKQMLTGNGVSKSSRNNAQVQANNNGVGYNTQGGVKHKRKSVKSKAKRSGSKAKKVVKSRKHRGGNPNAGATFMPTAYYNPNEPRVNYNNTVGQGFPCGPSKMFGGNPNAGATYMPPQFYNPNQPLRTGKSSTSSSFPCNDLTPSNKSFQSKGGSKISTSKHTKRTKSVVKRKRTKSTKTHRKQKGGKCPMNTSTSKCTSSQNEKAAAINCNLNEAEQRNNKLESTVKGSQSGGTGYDNPINNTLTNEIYGNYMDQAYKLNAWENKHYYRNAAPGADYSSASGSGKKRRSQKAGGSDFVSTWRSRGPVNYPNQDINQFRAFTKTGEYIPNNELAFAAAPVLTGCMPDNSPVKGFNIGDYVTGGVKKSKRSKRSSSTKKTDKKKRTKTPKRKTVKKSKTPKTKKTVKRTKSASKSKPKHKSSSKKTSSKK